MRRRGLVALALVLVLSFGVYAKDDGKTLAELEAYKKKLEDPNDPDFARLREKKPEKLAKLIARAERAIHEKKIQPQLDALPGATDPLLQDWFQGVVTKEKGDRLDLADAIHYYLKRRVTTKIALDIAESNLKFKFYDQGEDPPEAKKNEVWLELGEPFPLIAAKAIEQGSLALQKKKAPAMAEANAILRALHFLAVKKVPDGLARGDDPIFSQGAELRSNPDALVSLVEDRLGGSLKKKDRAKLEEKAFHHYTKHLPDDLLATNPTDGLASKILSSMVGAESPLAKIRRIAAARDALAERYGIERSVSTDELRGIIDDALRAATSPEEDAVER